MSDSHARTVLVTGGAGYVGTQVVDRLLRRGYRVRVLDALLYGAAPLRNFAAHPNFEFVRGDAADASCLRGALHGMDSVVHLAGVVGDAACAADETYAHEANVVMASMVKRTALECGATRLLLASSCSVYGATSDPATEDDAPAPLSFYARTKAAAESIFLDSPDGAAPTVLRFGTVFGHSRRPRFDLAVNLFTAQALTEGTITVKGGAQRRPFVHVGDLARAVDAVLSADPGRVRNQIFNVANPNLNVTIGQLADRIALLIRPYRPVTVKVNARGEDCRNYIVSTEKMRKALGFAPSTSLESGIRELISAFERGAYGGYGDATYNNGLAIRNLRAAAAL